MEEDRQYQPAVSSWAWGPFYVKLIKIAWFEHRISWVKEDKTSDNHPNELCLLGLEYGTVYQNVDVENKNVCGHPKKTVKLPKT